MIYGKLYIAKDTKKESIKQEEKKQVQDNVNNNVKLDVGKSGKGNTQVGYNKTYYIKVNYGANVVTVYKKDSNGEYTVPVKAMTCSTGSSTPKSGTYEIKGRWEWLALFGGVYGHYSTQIVGNILFHSVPYLERYNPGSLEYWEYDKLRNNLFCWLYKAHSGRCILDI